MTRITSQATQLKIAINDRNRSTIDLIDRRFNLNRLVKALIARRLITKSEALAALRLRSNISNPSCRYA